MVDLSTATLISSPVGICRVAEKLKLHDQCCDFELLSFYSVDPDDNMNELYRGKEPFIVSLWRCKLCKRYASTNQTKTGASHDYNITVGGIDPSFWTWKDYNGKPRRKA